MIDKSKLGQLALEIAEKVQAMRHLVQGLGGDEESAIAKDILMLGTATIAIAKKCGVYTPARR